MADTRVQVEGLNDLLRTLRAMGAELDDMNEAVAITTSLVAAYARGTAPVRSGDLAASVNGNRSRNRAVVSAGNGSVPYAGPIHWGWPRHHIAANPFIQRAARQTEPVWLAVWEREVLKAVNKVRGV